MNLTRPLSAQETIDELTGLGLLDLTARCAAVHRVTVRHMLCRSHVPCAAQARALLWACLRVIDRQRWSYPEIGRLFARDHTTIMSGVRGVADDEVTAMLLEQDDGEEAAA